jgi:hypothetical protein
MSDGPHKTLPMRPGWKRLSERADKTGYAAAEVAEAVCPALADDWRSEVSDNVVRQVRMVVGADAGGFLFSDQADRDLAALRDVAPSPLAGLYIDCVRDALAGGLRGEDACETGAEAALSERAASGIRQVEEHYRRNSGTTRTDSVRQRLDAATNAAPIRALAREVLTGRRGPAGVPPAKRTGIEEGPQL